MPNNDGEFGKIFVVSEGTGDQLANDKYKWGFAVTNRFLRVWCRNYEFDVDEAFVSKTYWRFIQVQYRKRPNHSLTEIDVWIDKGARTQTVIPAMLDNAATTAYMGENFAGYIRSVRIS